MIGVIITGHGQFAKGLESSVSFITGEHENFKTVDFLPNKEEDYARKLEEAINSMESLDGVIVFTDLMGGTPFRVSVTLSMEKDNCEVVAGTNLGMVIETLLSRDNYNCVTDLSKTITTIGKQQIINFDKENI